MQVHFYRVGANRGLTPMPATFSFSLSLYRVGMDLQGYLAHKNSASLGPYSRPMPKGLGWSLGGGLFPMSEAPLLSNHGNRKPFLTPVVVLTSPPRWGSGGTGRYWGTSLIRNQPPPGSYNRPMPKALRLSWGRCRFLCKRYPCKG